jgi:hypothetical protein
MSSVIASSDKYTVPPETRDFCLSMLLPSPARRRMHVPFQVHLTPTLIEPASHRSLPLAFMPRIVSVHSHNKQETSPKLVTYQPPPPPFDSFPRSVSTGPALSGRCFALVSSAFKAASEQSVANSPATTCSSLGCVASGTSVSLCRGTGLLRDEDRFFAGTAAADADMGCVGAHDVNMLLKLRGVWLFESLGLGDGQVEGEWMLTSQASRNRAGRAI